MGPRILLVREEVGLVDQMVEEAIVEKVEEAAVALVEDSLGCFRSASKADREYSLQESLGEHCQHVCHLSQALRLGH